MTIYPKKRNSKFYRKLWEQHHGCPIPKDEFGRTFDIHHIDGDYTNNSIENLYACPAQEHYDIHYSQGDWGACKQIARRMGMSPELISELARKAALKRVEDGTHNWTGSNNSVHERVANGTHNWLGDGTLQRTLQQKRVANGTHNFLGGELQRKRVEDGTHPFINLSRKRVADGTHNLLGDNNPNKKRVADGTHNWLGDGTFQRQVQQKRIDEGTHHFLGDNNPNNKRVADGTHHLLGNVSCVDRQGNNISVKKGVYQKQKEVTKDMTQWEFVSINSKEAKRRKEWKNINNSSMTTVTEQTQLFQ